MSDKLPKLLIALFVGSTIATSSVAGAKLLSDNSKNTDDKIQEIPSVEASKPSGPTGIAATRVFVPTPTRTPTPKQVITSLVVTPTLKASGSTGTSRVVGTNALLKSSGATGSTSSTGPKTATIHPEDKEDEDEEEEEEERYVVGKNEATGSTGLIEDSHDDED